MWEKIFIKLVNFMSINSNILPSSKDLKPFVKELKSITKSVETLIKKFMSPGDIDVVFMIIPGATLKENGIGGYTPCANVIFFLTRIQGIRNFEKESRMIFFIHSLMKSTMRFVSALQYLKKHYLKQ